MIDHHLPLWLSRYNLIGKSEGVHAMDMSLLFRSDAGYIWEKGMEIDHGG